VKVDVLVVGAGPAGLAAATTAGGLGAAVCLVDESYRTGGQYLRQRSTATRRPPAVVAVEASGATILLGDPVWHVDPASRTASVGSRRVEYGALVLATGAYDRVLAVPGGRLRGVVTAGAAQALAKDGVTLGRSVLVAGSGPFAFPVAEEVVRSGGGVAEVALSHWPVMSRAALHEPRVLPEGARYARWLLSRRVPVRAGWMLSEILGEDTVRGAVLTRDGRSRTVDCDAVAMGYGFLPQLALADIAGCRLRFDAVHRTWFVDVDDDLQTSVEGVVAAGEGTGIGGHRKATGEGRLAGHTAARLAGLEVRVPPRVRRSARRLQRFAREAAPYLAPPALPHAVGDDVAACRCEGVSAGQVLAAVDDGAVTVSGVRTRTRLGMGVCQGRMCGQVCAELVAARTGGPLEDVGRVTARTPARPLPLGSLS
jgi:NADPH-dependent 2,4-dienoyl-CoA reductase/sulfur reductase-like enzyme